MSTHLVLLVLLFVFNGVFALSEMAIVSARRGRLKTLEEKFPVGSRQALALFDNPARFLSFVQVGVTFISVMAGAFGGASFAGPVAEKLNTIPWLVPCSTTVAWILTVGFISYLNLVIGELLPKRIGLSYSEEIAVRVAPALTVAMRVVLPVVWVLDQSTVCFIKLFGLADHKEMAVTEDEVKDMIAEGTETGVFNTAEKNMMEGVLRLADRPVRSIMTPRVDMVRLSLEDPLDEVIETITQSGYTRFPVVEEDRMEILGLVSADDLLRQALEGKKLDLNEVMTEPLKVPDTTPILRLLEEVKKSGKPMMVVVDEYGSVEGIVTITDILEAIIGVMPKAGKDQEDPPVCQDDGSWLMDGMTAIDVAENLLGLRHMRGNEDFHTLAGFMIDHLGRVPVAGDAFVWHGVRFSVVDMDGLRVDKVMIVFLKEENPDD